ncbi:hypothetical protein CCR75_001734 [Bremia lactucae]|uniref:Uncharacterized protein n=1 Tax=Bremia lactucae TaxID=4779 RepID=A0A976FGM9_BRELC|nr:hypothetical protein CCR75_001734 [Bremia lactucae]
MDVQASSRYSEAVALDAKAGDGLRALLSEKSFLEEHLSAHNKSSKIFKKVDWLNWLVLVVNASGTVMKWLDVVESGS